MKFFVWAPDKVLMYLEFRAIFAWTVIETLLMPKLDRNESQLETTNVGNRNVISDLPHVSAYHNRKWICQAKQPHQNMFVSGQDVIKGLGIVLDVSWGKLVVHLTHF